MDFYKDLQAVASDVLSTFRQGDIKLVKFEPVEVLDENGVVIPPSPDQPAETEEVLHDLKGTVRGVSFKYLSSSFVTATDLEVTTAVLDGVEVSVNDLIEIDGVRYNIVEDVSVPAAGVRVAWKFIVRKGG